MNAPHQRPAMVDPFGRIIDYLRVSVTDRCDLRCVYCMSERPTFLPKAQVLTIEELDRLCSAFIGLGARRLRLTGGEPLVRRGFMDLIAGLSRHIDSGALEELTLTTNGTRLREFAGALAGYGVRRINVSVDTLDPDAFRRITRGGDLQTVLAGIGAAQEAGIRVKINTVALKQDNQAELPQMVKWAHSQGCDITLIETMPLGEVEEDRTDQYLPLSKVRQDLESFWTLTPLPDRTSGPARYDRVEETGGRIGFITPLSHNFCESCNRVRVTCTGTLYMCLGQDDAADLRAPLRESHSDAPLVAAIREALTRKPKGHDFVIERRGAAPAVGRTMATTGADVARVLMLGRLRDVAGWREQVVEGASVAELVQALAANDAALGEALRGKGVQVALNKTVVRGDHPLAANDEVAFLPPMSGGAEVAIRVQVEAFDPGALLSAFSAGRLDTGGVVSFTGLARRATDGAAVATLTLDAYPGFTETAIEAMEAQARARFAVQDILIVHRYGPIAPGEAIVFVAAAAEHRREAFQAADHLMDRLKTEAPFWKKETGPDGERWIEPRPRDYDDAQRWSASHD